MKIGELSQRTGVSVRMLRFYETEGLLAPRRTDRGYRVYGPPDEEAVRRIKELGAAGMTLAEIRLFLPCALAGRSEFEPCDELKALLRRQIDRVDGRIAVLGHSRSVLAALLSRLDAESAG
jgi:DNA-binding transcriptional MerR regulator